MCHIFENNTNFPRWHLSKVNSLKIRQFWVCRVDGQEKKCLGQIFSISVRASSVNRCWCFFRTLFYQWVKNFKVNFIFSENLHQLLESILWSSKNRFLNWQCWAFQDSVYTVLHAVQNLEVTFVQMSFSLNRFYTTQVPHVYT